MKVVYGGYGHHPSGKQYAYVGNDNLRTGQNVVAPVTDKRTGKTYNTMFTIMRTSAGQMGENEGKRLSQQGIGLKSITSRDVMNDLPTGRLIKNYGNLFGIDQSAAGWARASKATYENKVAQRLNSYANANSGQMRQMATSRLLGGAT